MRDEDSSSMGWWRRAALACIVALGLASIVGSGGIAFMCCDWYFPTGPITPTVEPPNITVQVGGTAVFSVQTPGISNPTYQWSRTPTNGPPVNIPGATDATYALSGANLADDGATYSVTVSGFFDGGPTVLVSTPGRLAVSSMPGFVFQDGEFLLADWAVAAIAEPALNGPTHSEEQATSGGNPGAYRRVTITMSHGPSKLDLFHTFQSSTYDPASQGPIYLIDFTQDCIRLPGSLGSGPTLLIEQDGRRYIAGAPTDCNSIFSNTVLFPPSFGKLDFVQVTGPNCAARESCPDFSASGGPIHFGFATSNEALPGISGVYGGFGIDNWKVTVWRR